MKIKILGLIFALLFISIAQAADPIGKVLTVEGTAHINSLDVKTGDLIHLGDIIDTQNGKLGIAFADGSSFNISSNAKMTVDEFVYNPKGHDNQSKMSLVTGTFTFIAGEVAHTGSMKVNTPVGTMGIRGTAPRVEILPDGSVRFSTLVETQ